MGLTYCYVRLFIACWLFVGGVAIQFVPSVSSEARASRWRERQLQNIPSDQHARWIDDQDTIDSNTQAYQRLFGVMLGGTGLAMALRETAFLTAKYGRAEFRQ